ncbi:hypothetical protein [Streptomyces acidiscabies]|uniref:hypothetical protein n=1 Tax=Streptomyces acidiscabies TaxID=42234 RepID=UPI000952B5E6|nr:hypothetical protein [Streptomyces acidiscabies]
MIAEAIDTALALGWALAAWIAVGAAMVTVLLLAGCAAVASVVRVACGALDAVVAAVRTLRAAQSHPAPERPTDGHTRARGEAA